MKTKKLQILLVEDDEVDVMNVERAFAKNGLEVGIDIADDGVQALDMLRESRRQQRSPNLVILDLNLPRMNGIEFLSRLRGDTELTDLPVVVLTTSDEERDIREALRLHVAGFFVKPIGFERFVEMMGVIGAYWVHCENAIADPAQEY